MSKPEGTYFVYVCPYFFLWEEAPFWIYFEYIETIYVTALLGLSAKGIVHTIQILTTHGPSYMELIRFPIPPVWSLHTLHGSMA